MIRKQNKYLDAFHILMGMFFGTTGVILIVQSNTIKGTWLFLLGLLFVLDFLQKTVLKLPKKVFGVVQVIIAVLIIIFGVYVLGYQ